MISCVIPAYENAALFRLCLDSARAQTGVDLEIIVTDDSGSGAIAALTREAAQSDPRIRYIEGARTGNAVDNWNHGLDATRGALAVLLHQDERFIDPTYLKRASDRLSGDDIVAVVAGTAVTGVTRPSRFALASTIVRRLPAPAWWLPAFNWIGPTAAFVFHQPRRFDRTLVQLADVEFYHRVLRGRRWARLEGVCVISLGHHPDQITARIDPHAAARSELTALASRMPPAIGRVQGALAHLATRFRSRNA